MQPHFLPTSWFLLANYIDLCQLARDQSPITDILLIPHDSRHFLFIRGVHTSRPRLESQVPIKSDKDHFRSVPIASWARSEDSGPIDEMIQLERSDIEYSIIHCPFVLFSFM